MKKEVQISYIRQGKDGNRTLRRRTLEELVSDMLGNRFESVIEKYRCNIPLIQREPISIRESLSNQLLEELPEVCFATDMAKTSGEEKIYAYNPLLLLTISSLRNRERVDELKDKASMLPYTRLAFTGADGLSLCIVCELQPLRKSLETKEDYQQLLEKGYASLRMIYSDHMQASVDVVKPELSITCRLSRDKNLFFNPLSEVFHVDMLSSCPTPFDTSKEPMPLQVEDKEELFEWRRIFIDNLKKARLNTKDKDFETLLLLAHYCHETGMPQAIAERWSALALCTIDDEVLIRDTFTSEYDKELKEYSKYKHANATAQMIMRTSRFLNANFRFRRNVLNGIVEYRMNDGSDFDYHLLTPEAQNTMTIMALESGLNSWDKDLNRYIHSRRITEYDPVNSFLDNLPKWDGKDRIADMAHRIPTDTPNWEQNFHIWMLSMVAQWMGRDDQHGNAIAPILIGAQATGKSSFCRIILPEELSPYYNDSINFKDDKSVFLALSSFALINIDEFDSLSKSQQPLLKYLISKTDVKFRAAYTNYIAQHKRYASFIGTTNKLRPLSDPTGSRRFICVHVTDSIDFTTPVEYEQLYAQLREEVMKGERYWFTKEEADAITLQNSQYQRAGDISIVLNTLFRQPAKNETCSPLSIEEITKIIANEYPEFDSSQDTNMKIGRVLTKLGFEQVRGRTGRKYLLVQK